MGMQKCIPFFMPKILTNDLTFTTRVCIKIVTKFDSYCIII